MRLISHGKKLKLDSKIKSGWMGANNDEMEDIAADRSSQSALESEDVSKRK